MSNTKAILTFSARALTLAVALCCASSLDAQIEPLAAPDDLRVTYLANEGFLIEAGGRKILIDALFGRGVPGYAFLPADLRSELMAAEGRFADVDLVLATHYHRDHFDAATVAAHLRANRGALFVSTEQALAALEEVAPGLVDGGRARGLYPEAGERIRVSRAGIDLDALRLHHGPGGTQNLGFLLTVDGWRLLHVGDTEASAEDFAVNNLVDERIDVAFLPDWYLRHPGSRELVDRVIRPARVVAMHMARPEAPPSYFGKLRNPAGVREAIRLAFPEATILTEPGDAATLVRDADEERIVAGAD